MTVSPLFPHSNNSKKPGVDHRRFFFNAPGLTIVLLLLAFALPSASLAQQVEFSSSMNPVGSGARATGMGGAFIAVADDATAASWNPAGLIHLEKPEVSFVYSYFKRGQSYNSSSHPELGGTTHQTELGDVNFASLAVPFVLFDRNMVVSMNYQRLYDMNKNSSISYRWDLMDGDYMNDRISFSQSGYLGAISPAIAIQLLPELYFGATVNFWSNTAGTCNWQNNYRSIGRGALATATFPPDGIPFTETVDWTNKYSLSGTNANLGLLYTLNGKYSIGLVYKTPFTAKVTKQTAFAVEQKFPDFPDADSSSLEVTEENIKFKMPASYGIGLAYRHSDSLTLALDVYRTEWSAFAIIDARGSMINPITGANIRQGKPHDTTQVRMGGEYLFIGDKAVIPLRAGIFYDPEPGKEGVDNFYGFSVGSGIAYGKVAVDFSYQYRWGNRVTGDIPQPGINSDIEQHTLMASMIYYF